MAILSASLASFAAITFCVVSQRVFIVIVVYFVIESVRKFLDTPRVFKHNISVQFVTSSVFCNSSATESIGM
jgi:hypothetical protein